MWAWQELEVGVVTSTRWVYGRHEEPGAGQVTGARCMMLSNLAILFFLKAVMRRSDLWGSKCRFIVVIMWIYRCGNVDLCNLHDLTCRPEERGYQQGH